MLKVTKNILRCCKYAVSKFLCVCSFLVVNHFLLKSLSYKEVVCLASQIN